MFNRKYIHKCIKEHSVRETTPYSIVCIFTNAFQNTNYKGDNSIFNNKYIHKCILRIQYRETTPYFLERSGSVVECLTHDRGVVGSSLTSITALWSLTKTHLS